MNASQTETETQTQTYETTKQNTVVSYDNYVSVNYEKIEDTERSEDLYRSQLLQVFHLDNNIDDDDLFMQLSSSVSQIKDILLQETRIEKYALRLANRALSNDLELGIFFLFSYDYFWITHTFICILLKYRENKQEYSYKENIDTLCKLLDERIKGESNE